MPTSFEMRQAGDCTFFFSDRELPLVFYWQGDYRPDVPMLTVENYCKWYDVYLVHSDGRVEKVDVEMWDHRVPPHEVKRLSSLYEWDEQSLEMIVGRFWQEHFDRSFENIFNYEAEYGS